MKGNVQLMDEELPNGFHLLGLMLLLEDKYLHLFHIYKHERWTIRVVPYYIFLDVKNAGVRMPNLFEHVNRVYGSPVTPFMNHLSVDVHTVIFVC